MKKCILLSIITILIFTLVVPTGCKAAKFVLSSLEITPSTVATGDTATISVDLANIGSAEGTYTVTFSLDGVVIDTMDVTIPTETTREVTFTVVKETVGEYTVEIGSLSGTLHVVKPAEFQLSSLVVTPQEVLPPEEVTVTVDVSNVGGLVGDYTCTLIVSTRIQESKEITVDGGETETVTFTFPARYTGGRCEIEVGDLTEEIITLRPADIRVTSVSASPEEIETGSSVTVSVNLYNYGDVEGNETVTLEVDGKSVGTRIITVGGKDTTRTATINFTVTEDTIGRHRANVGGKSDYFLVTPVVPAGYVGFTGGSFPWQTDFFIAYPEGWEEQEGDELLNVIAPMQGDGTFPSFIVHSESLPQEMTLLEYFEIASLVYSFFPNYQVVSTEEVTINGIPAVKHTMTMSAQGINVTVTQVYLINDDTVYLITIGASTAYYSEFTETFDTIINSFQIYP
ncbi:MAG: DcrB-related protein [Dehalococcoidales bacterium]|nr:MAG: DcrB-related protein [Dehalococcoidales bacterium]